MAALVAVTLLGLLAYVPGRCLSRLLLPEEPLPCGRLLLELVVGNAAVGLIGLFAAELGVFSLGLVGVALAGLSGAALIAARGRRVAGYGVADLGGLALAAATLIWVMPPFETALYGYDSSVYASAGLSLARHGSIPFVDPTVAELPMESRRELFPAYGLGVDRPPFLRASGGLLLSSLETPRVLPAFHYPLCVWVALAWEVAGDVALGAPVAYFAALAVWSVAAFAALAGGVSLAGISAVLLLLSGPQYWYSRFLMPEVPSQFFLWAGLTAAAASLSAKGRVGLIAGVGVGMAGMLRIDGLGHLVATLALWIGAGGAALASGGFLLAFGVIGAYALLHLALFPTHYGADVVNLGERLLFFWQKRTAAAGAFVAGLTERPGPGWMVRLACLAAFAAYLTITLASTRPDFAEPLDWLSIYAGWPVLLLALAGVVPWWRRAPSPPLRFALVLALVVFVQLLYDPRVTPAPLWAIRRFVPILVPAVCLAAAFAVDRIARRRVWVAPLAIAVIAAGAWSHTSFAYRGSAFESSMAHVRAIAANLPPGSVLVFDPQIARDTQMHISLWAARDVPAYLFAAGMKKEIEKLRAAMPARPIYWLGAPTPSERVDLDGMAEPVATYRFGLATRRIDWYDARDDLGVRDINLTLYRIRRSSAAAALH